MEAAGRRLVGLVGGLGQDEGFDAQKCASEVMQERPERGIGDHGFQLSLAMGALRLAVRGDMPGSRQLRHSPAAL